MNNEAARKSWGSGRVAFMARLHTIKSEMGQGHPLTAIFDRHQAALGIGYASFCKLVSRYADDAKLARRRTLPRAQASGPAPLPKPMPTAPAVAPKPSLLPLEGASDARHEPAVRPTFKHHGVVQEGEPEQLLGPGFLKRRG